MTTERRAARVPAVLGMALLAAACTPGAFDPGRGAACGAYASPNQVLRTVSLAAAEEYRQVLPALGVRPELESTTPALVVVFQGPMRDTEIRGGGLAAPVSALKHVCVVFVDGSTHFYANVEVGGLLPLPVGTAAPPP